MFTVTWHNPLSQHPGVGDTAFSWQRDVRLPAMLVVRDADMAVSVWAVSDYYTGNKQTLKVLGHVYDYSDDCELRVWKNVTAEQWAELTQSHTKWCFQQWV